jgi:hypothetical protein
MKKRSDELLRTKAVVPTDSKLPAKSHVRYIGFESIDAGRRRLRFRVKPNGCESVDVTFDVPDAPFINTSGISIQDAAPMAYEKLVEILATESTLYPDKLCLTDADIANYLNRHLSSQKRPYSTRDEKHESDLAA